MNVLTSGGALVLALDASVYVGTVAVLRGSRLVCTREARMRGENEERLLPAVAHALHEAGAAPSELTAIVCGAGPGSFTSLRIAASIAKGLAAARGCALYAAPSLALVVAGSGDARGAGRWLASLDAMRGERFAAVVTTDASGQVREVGPTMRVVGADLERVAREHDALLVPHDHGAGAPHARGVASMLELLGARGPVDLDAWEPDYGRLAEAQVKWEAAHGRPLAGG